MDEERVEQADNGPEMTPLDYLRVVWARRKLIGTLCVISMLVAFVYSLFIPKSYRATASILPPMEIGIGGETNSRLRSEAAGDWGGLFGGLPESKGLFSLVASTPTRDTFAAILKSRSMREEVVRHFSKTWGPSASSLIGGVEILTTKEGVMMVTAEGGNPKLTADVANFYFDNLLDIARRGQNSMQVQLDYYKGKLDQAKRDLDEAQTGLIEFQEKHRYIALDAGTRSAIASGAGQAGSVMGLEMERAIKRSYLTDSHPEMIAMDRRIYEAKKLISHQLYGDAQPLPPESPGAPPRKEFFVATAKMTPLQFKLADVYRNLKFREALWSHIINNIETLKYTSDNPTSIHIDWLDRAVPPGGPFKPNIPYNVAAVGIASLVAGIFLSFILEYLARMKGAEDPVQEEVRPFSEPATAKF